MDEIWKDIQGYERLYQVSNLGRVKALPRTDSNNRHRKERIMKQFRDKDGYYILGLTKNHKHKTVRVHRLVANAFVQNPLNLPQVNHINEIKTDNRAENLEWCTDAYNLTYGSREHQFAGENNNKAKLTIEDVENIRAIYVKGDRNYGQSALGKKYGLSHTQIANIVKNKSWNL